MLSQNFFKTSLMKKVKKEVLEDFNLTKIEMLGSSGNFDTSKCRDKTGKLYMLKIRRKKDVDTRQKFLREIFANQTLCKIKNSSIEFPEYLSSQTQKKPEWLIYKFISGQPVGNWNYFYQNDFKKISDKLPNIIIAFLKVRVSNKTFKPVRAKEFDKNFKSYKKTMKEFFSQNEITQGNKIIKNNKSLLNKTKLFLTHGDLHPANIILTPKGKLSVIDWFDSQLNNRVYDTCFLWFKLWNHPQEQKKFLEKIINQDKNSKEFEKLFIINTICLTPKMLKVANDVRQSLDKNEKIEIKTNNSLIKYLINNYKQTLKNYENCTFLY